MSWVTHAFAFLLIAVSCVAIIVNPFLRFLFGTMAWSLLQQMAAHPIVAGAALLMIGSISAGVGLALDRKGWPATCSGILAAASLAVLLALG